jgi:hypothetical protein
VDPAAGNDLRAALGARVVTSKKDEGPAILDNVPQFRFFSAWKAAIARSNR